MRYSIALAAAGTLLLPPLREQPAFHAVAGARLTKTYTEKLEADLESLHVWAGGEEVPADELGDPELHIESLDKRVFTDHYVSVGPDLPTVLERTFDDLAARSVERSKNDGDDHEDTRERESKLTGKTVVFTRAEGSDKVKVAFKDDKGDAALLEGLEEDTDLRVFLPAKSVSEGDTWDVEAKAYNTLTFPGGELHMEATEEEDDPIDRSQLRDNVDGKIVAKYAGRRDIDGVSAHVIELTFDVRTHADDEGEIKDEESEGKAHRKRHFGFEHELKGELLWSVDGHALGLSVEGRTKIALDEDATFETDDGEYSFKQKYAFAGTTAFEVKFAKAE